MRPKTAPEKAANPSFKDYFSAQAQDYARFRVRYPPALFEALAQLCPEKTLAWDCGTGNGQAAWGLAERFDAVIASDASEEQIKHAVPHPRITYRTESAERSSLENGSANLVTAAQAVHWFKLDSFWKEVQHVTKPGGIIAVWCYELPQIEKTIDAIVRRYEREMLGEYWAPEIQHVWTRYQNLHFPFPTIQMPKFTATTEWTLDDLIGHLRTWSAARRYQEKEGKDSLLQVLKDLQRAWEEPGKARPVTWLIDMLLVGKVWPAGGPA